MSDFDFVALKQRYDKLPPGPRADIRRAAEPDDLGLVGAFYRLLPPGAAPSDQWKRIVLMLPYASHQEGGPSFGHALRKAGVAEARLFQMVRSSSPQDLLRLRRLLKHIKPALDWREFGQALYYWGDHSKQNIVRDYYYDPEPQIA